MQKSFHANLNAQNVQISGDGSRYIFFPHSFPSIFPPNFAVICKAKAVVSTASNTSGAAAAVATAANSCWVLERSKTIIKSWIRAQETVVGIVWEWGKTVCCSSCCGKSLERREFFFCVSCGKTKEIRLKQVLGRVAWRILNFCLIEWNVPQGPDSNCFKIWS